MPFDLLLGVYSTPFFFYMENLFMCIYVLTYLITMFVSAETEGRSGGGG